MVNLREIPLFSVLPKHELAQLAAAVVHRDYAKGDILFWEGEQARGLCYVKSGKVQLSKSNYEGKRVILGIFCAGDFFAEAVLGSDCYPATAETVEPSSVYFIATEALEGVMLRHPTIALTVVMDLSKRLLEAQDKLRDQTFSSAESRLAKLLTTLASKHGKPEVGGLAIAIELPHSRLAALTGLSRETVSRILSFWRKEGVINGKQRKVFITNLMKLNSYIEE